MSKTYVVSQTALNPKRKPEALARTPTTIVLSREEDAALRK
jgi:hypothetical protein